MPSTTPDGYPYPNLTDTPNVPADIQALAGAVQASVGAAWTAYDPGWTAASAAPSVGNGTLTGLYKKLGNSVKIQIDLLFGSTTNGGKGAYTFALPPSMPAGHTQSNFNVYAVTADGAEWFGGAIVLGGELTLRPYLPKSPTAASVAPVRNTDATGNPGTGIPALATLSFNNTHGTIVVTGQYEIA